MRFIILLAVVCGMIRHSHGQEVDSIKQSDLDSLYIRTIRNQIHLMLSSGHKYFEITDNTLRIKDNVNVDIFKFLTHWELIEKSIKEKKQIIIYRVVHKIISADTIDINIGVVTVTAKRSLHFKRGLRTKKANFALSCGGTNGYIPTDRYAYNVENDVWNRIEFIKPDRFRDK